ncbi:hypothetical protein N752_14975 [Desulforamulus aquiferis]|nr:hypothetical protein N752_14975 [Desulforamulus aquiferis]
MEFNHNLKSYPIIKYLAIFYHITVKENIFYDEFARFLQLFL